MRCLRYLATFALLALLLTPYLCHAGMAAKRMMAVMGIPSTGSTGFEAGYGGWISNGDPSFLYRSSSAAHTGTMSIIYPNSTATATFELTQHIYSKGGYLTVWVRTPSVSSAVSTITPYIDTVVEDTLNSNTPNTWQQFSIPITQGWHDVVFQFTRASAGTGDVYLDDIVVP